MYLALASYVLNGQQVVQSPADLERVMPQVAPLFLRQGFQESSSAGPFEDYLALGMGKAPLLVAYESQLVEFLLRHPQRRSGEMVMLYPQPTLYSKHVLVPYTPAGDRVGQLLESDPQLRALAQEYGFSHRRRHARARALGRAGRAGARAAGGGDRSAQPGMAGANDRGHGAALQMTERSRSNR
jgi:hypothetical protein